MESNSKEPCETLNRGANRLDVCFVPIGMSMVCGSVDMNGISLGGPMKLRRAAEMRHNRGAV